ncbi:hypothetical protein EC988_003023, partial [Linderina pennispora]
LNDSSSVKDIGAYSVAVDSGENSKSGVYDVTSINVHPGYQPQSVANNIAIIQFAVNSKKSWTNAIGINPREYTNHVFVRRVSKDVAGETWVTPSKKSSVYQPDGCANASP